MSTAAAVPVADLPADPEAPHVLSPTERTVVSRGRNRAVHDRSRLLALLREGLVAHVGLDAAGHPVVLPSAYAVDPAGPDAGGTLYLHGSVGAGWVRRLTVGDRAPEACVTVTELDGLVLGRSAFHHSMNYRSAVVIGAVRLVDDADEKQRALDLIIDHMVPGRSATLRRSTRKELSATAVLAVPLVEASMKERAGGPGDEEADVASGTWGGHVPLRRVADTPVSCDLTRGPVPREVAARAAYLSAR